MQHFFSGNITEGTIHLDENESAHAIRVLRLKEGDSIRVLDGKGNIYNARILRAHPRHTEAVIEETRQYKSRAPWHLHLAVAPTKNIERFEFLLEKVTETGVDEITPLLCERSERRKLRHDRLERVLAAAVKQSLQPFLPRLHPLTPFGDFINRPFSGDKMLAHCCEQKDPARMHLYDRITSPQVIVLVGPEGDFTSEEIAKALEAGYTTVSLGSTRLRTETAGIAAALITATHFRDLEEF